MIDNKDIVVASYVYKPTKHNDIQQYNLIYASDTFYTFYVDHPFIIYTPKNFIEWMDNCDAYWELKIYNQDLFLIARLLHDC